jgi:hypothetical protein
MPQKKQQVAVESLAEDFIETSPFHRSMKKSCV